MLSQMNSRERVLTALNHKEPEMVAIDFGGSKISGIMAVAITNLKDILTSKTDRLSFTILNNS